MINIIGEYVFNIKIPTMFGTYEIETKNHNLITDAGLNLILKSAINQGANFMGNIHLGTNSQEPTVNDTTETFQNPIELPPKSVKAKNNNIIYEVDTKGSNINETTEIGVWSDDKNILVSRDVHDRYDVPHNAIITLQYIFTLNQTIEEDVIDD